ncbi:MAG: N-formylglutamate amidohydrolase [Alphaproteobacteria bacterium]
MDAGPAIDPLDPPFVVRLPTAATAPVVFASPHSGRVYPEAFLRASRIDPLGLRSSEDAFIDELFADAPALGMPMIEARFPRAYVDANRGPWELDPGMFADRLPEWVEADSPRAAAGLGTIARVVSDGEEIYAGKLRFAEARSRIEALHLPYHRRLDALVEEAQAGWGVSLLVDCHSMPSSAAPAPAGLGGARAGFVIGDRHGSACDGGIVAVVEDALRARGHRVLRNDPYAGGFTTRRHGRPAARRHALQVEVNRALYMDEARLEPLPCFAALRDDLRHAMEALREHMRGTATTTGDEA